MIALAGLIFAFGGAILYIALNNNPFDGNLFYADGSFDFNKLNRSIEDTQLLVNAFIWTLIVGGVSLAIGSLMRSDHLWKLRSSSQTALDQLSVKIKKLEEQIKKLKNEKS